ncbi:TetR/AcrR family transcriptional regulator [Streptomyces sp. NPDC052494]|uniref:TetR/AcrR family transcriptional regulator n=1 Tax=Streptomyces sp. NPDC052494 TaxID=3365692 RepID=UPI0037D32844
MTTLSSKAGTKGVPRADREQQILAAATEEFGRHGYEATTVAAIAVRVGVTKPLLHQYFGSKQGLYLACLDPIGDRLLDAIRAAMAGHDTDAPPTPLRVLNALFTALDGQRRAWFVLYDPTASRQRRRPARRALPRRHRRPRRDRYRRTPAYGRNHRPTGRRRPQIRLARPVHRSGPLVDRPPRPVARGHDPALRPAHRGRPHHLRRRRRQHVSQTDAHLLLSHPAFRIHIPESSRTESAAGRPVPHGGQWAPRGSGKQGRSRIRAWAALMSRPPADGRHDERAAALTRLRHSHGPPDRISGGEA